MKYAAYVGIINSGLNLKNLNIRLDLNHHTFANSVEAMKCET